MKYVFKKFGYQSLGLLFCSWTLKELKKSWQHALVTEILFPIGPTNAFYFA